jgi:hypothetical protein
LDSRRRSNGEVLYLLSYLIGIEVCNTVRGLRLVCKEGGLGFCELVVIAVEVKDSGRGDGSGGRKIGLEDIGKRLNINLNDYLLGQGDYWEGLGGVKREGEHERGVGDKTSLGQLGSLGRGKVSSTNSSIGLQLSKVTSGSNTIHHIIPVKLEDVLSIVRESYLLELCNAYPITPSHECGSSRDRNGRSSASEGGTKHGGTVFDDFEGDGLSMGAAH